MPSSCFCLVARLLTHPGFFGLARLLTHPGGEDG